ALAPGDGARDHGRLGAHDEATHAGTALAQAAVAAARALGVDAEGASGEDARLGRLDGPGGRGGSLAGDGESAGDAGEPHARCPAGQPVALDVLRLPEEADLAAGRERDDHRVHEAAVVAGDDERSGGRHVLPPLHREAQVGAQRRSDEDPAQEPLADSGRGAAWHVASVTGATVVPVTVSPQPSAPAGHGTLALTVQGGALTSGFFTP